MDLVCQGDETVATISNPYGVANEEAGLALYHCLEPDTQLSGVGESVKHCNRRSGRLASPHQGRIFRR